MVNCSKHLSSLRNAALLVAFVALFAFALTGVSYADEPAAEGGSAEATAAAEEQAATQQKKAPISIQEAGENGGSDEGESGTDPSKAETPGLHNEGGKVYYIQEDGSMLKSSWKTVDGGRYYFDADGYAYAGWHKIGGYRYYFDPDTCQAYRWEHTIKGKFYYFDGKYRMHTGWLTWSGDKTKSYFDTDGAARAGWQKIGGKRYYFDKKTYKAYKWEHVIEGKHYYFDGSGVMHTGWLKWKKDGRYTWYKPNGEQVFGTYTIDGIKYKFDKNGKTKYDPKAVAQRLKMKKKAKKMSSKTKYLILVDTKKCRLAVFRGKKNNWDLIKYWKCSCGKKSTPTKRGTFTIKSKIYAFGHGYTCYWASQFSGNYLIHSIKYHAGTHKVKDGRLGKHVSKGCVRLPIEHAKWIYKNIPSGTKIKTY